MSGPTPKMKSKGGGGKGILKYFGNDRKPPNGDGIRNLLCGGRGTFLIFHFFFSPRGRCRIPGSIRRFPVVSETPPELKLLPFRAQMGVPPLCKFIKPPLEMTFYSAVVILFSSLRVHNDPFPVMSFRPDFTVFTRRSKRIPFRPAGPKRVFMNPSE